MMICRDNGKRECQSHIRLRGRLATDKASDLIMNNDLYFNFKGDYDHKLKICMYNYFNPVPQCLNVYQADKKQKLCSIL